MLNESFRVGTRSIQRQQLFVAPRLQGRLLFRSLCYCFTCTAMTACCYAAAHGLLGQRLGLIPWLLTGLVALVLVFPFVVFDSVRLSNRVTGPLVRAQGVMRRMAAGERVSQVQSRVGDPWEEWVQDFNAMVSEVEASRAALPTPSVAGPGLAPPGEGP